MEERVDFITLETFDLAALRHFYVEGLGWAPTQEVPDEVVFIQVNHGLMFSLYNGTNATEPANPAHVGTILSHNVSSPEEVDRLLEEARAAGGTITSPGQSTSWGGYVGIFADPHGHRWEIAHNPAWTVHPDGRVTL